MRKCIVKGKEYYFHMWGNTPDLSNNPDTDLVTYTVGIIESVDDGQVRTCFPYEIMFLEKPESDIRTTVTCDFDSILKSN